MLNDTRPLTQEERKALSDRVLKSDVGTAKRALRWAQERAHMEKYGTLPPVFPSLMTQVKRRAPTVREQMIADGLIKAKP